MHFNAPTSLPILCPTPPPLLPPHPQQRLQSQSMHCTAAYMPPPPPPVRETHTGQDPHHPATGDVHTSREPVSSRERGSGGVIAARRKLSLLGQQYGQQGNAREEGRGGRGSGRGAREGGG